MPVPVAVAAVLSFIARQGVKQAIKKFGRKAVDEARKHGRDMVTKPTAGQKKVAQATKGQRATRQSVRRTAAAGAASTAAGYSAGKSSNDLNTSKPKAVAKKDPRANPSDYPTYRKSSKSAVSFREAQRKAKSNNQKTFTWEGRRYNTKEK
jgi:type II secretory pathway component GspD/PulD (secretin)